MPYKNKEDKKKNARKYYQKNKKIMDNKSCEFRLSNPYKHNRYCKNYRDRNKIKRKVVCMNWAKNNLDKKRRIENRYRKKRWHNDKDFNIKVKLRNRFYFILKKYLNTGKIMSSGKYGIDYKIIIEQLKPFPEDLSKFHLDHIQPLCSFTFSKEDGSIDLEEIKRSFSPENLQWLTAEENLSKGGRWDGN